MHARYLHNYPTVVGLSERQTGGDPVLALVQCCGVILLGVQTQKGTTGNSMVVSVSTVFITKGGKPCLLPPGIALAGQGSAYQRIEYPGIKGHRV